MMEKFIENKKCTCPTLEAAQAFNESISRHIFALLRVLEEGHMPNKATLIKALQETLRISWQEGERTKTAPRKT